MSLMLDKYPATSIMAYSAMLMAFSMSHDGGISSDREKFERRRGEAKSHRSLGMRSIVMLRES